MQLVVKVEPEHVYTMAANTSQLGAKQVVALAIAHATFGKGLCLDFVIAQA